MKRLDANSSVMSRDFDVRLPKVLLTTIIRDAHVRLGKAEIGQSSNANRPKACLLDWYSERGWSSKALYLPEEARSDRAALGDFAISNEAYELVIGQYSPVPCTVRRYAPKVLHHSPNPIFGRRPQIWVKGIIRTVLAWCRTFGAYLRTLALHVLRTYSRSPGYAIYWDMQF